MTELVELHKKLMSCKFPEDLFGDLPGDHSQQFRLQKNIFRSFVKVCSPATNGDKETARIANEALTIVIELNKIAKDRIIAGTYGERTTDFATIITKNHTYKVLSHLAVGDYSNVYLAETDDELVCIKVMEKNPKLLKNEIDALKKLNHASMLKLVDGFTTNKGKSAIVTKLVEGKDFNEAVQSYPEGFPEEYTLGIADRLLGWCSYIHQEKFLNGNLEPSNIIINPSNHNVTPIDYIFSVRNFSRKKKYVGCNNFSAPEVTKKGTNPSTISDIYSIGKCILFLLSGGTFKRYDHNDLEIWRFFERFIQPDPDLRVDDVHRLWFELDKFRSMKFGPQTFKPWKIGD